MIFTCKECKITKECYNLNNDSYGIGSYYCKACLQKLTNFFHKIIADEWEKEYGTKTTS